MYINLNVFMSSNEYLGENDTGYSGYPCKEEGNKAYGPFRKSFSTADLVNYL